MKNKTIYLDHAAATPMGTPARHAMDVATRLTGNPSSFNYEGRRAAESLDSSRMHIARFLGARSGELVFTASGSEANTMAIVRLARANTRGHIITTPVEHRSVLDAVGHLQKQGHRVTVVPVDETGCVSADAVLRAVRRDTLLISVMYANNEIGTIQPVAEIGRRLRAIRRAGFPLFHTDACQATAYLPMNVHRLGVDLLTMNSAKVYGPRGIGALYVRRGVRLARQVFGGEQEHGLRAGTENVPAAAGFSAALDDLHSSDAVRVAGMRDYFLSRLQGVLPDVRVNGPSGVRRLANNIHLSVPGLDSEPLLLELDKFGIAAGSGSACTAHHVEPSHVLTAMGVRRPYLTGALRFTLGRTTTRKDMDRLLQVLPAVVRTLRRRYGV